MESNHYITPPHFRKRLPTGKGKEKANMPEQGHKFGMIITLHVNALSTFIDMPGELVAKACGASVPQVRDLFRHIRLYLQNTLLAYQLLSKRLISGKQDGYAEKDPYPARHRNLHRYSDQLHGQTQGDIRGSRDLNNNLPPYMGFLCMPVLLNVRGLASTYDTPWGRSVCTMGS